LSTRTDGKWRRRAAAGVISSLLALASADGALANESAAKKPAGPAFVKLPPLVLPIFDGAAIRGQASLILSLELVDGKPEEDVAVQQRRLVDAFLETLSLVYEERAKAERVIESATVKTRLKAAADRVLGQGVVREVLILQAAERSARRIR
jgi:hypothetical protein